MADSFMGNLSSLMRRIKGDRKVTNGNGGLTFIEEPIGSLERKRLTKLQTVIRYVNERNWNRRHIEFFDDFRRMSDTFPIIKAALDIYGEEAAVVDTDGNVFKIISDNKKVKDELEKLYFKYLNINSKAFIIIRGMCQFGNQFLYHVFRPGYGIVDTIFLPPEEVQREDMYDPNDLQKYRFTWYGGSSEYFESIEISHFKNVESIENLPYGVSILRPIIDTWRRVVLMREALIIYRITRAPSRLLFKVATDGLTSEESLNYVRELKKDTAKKPMVDPQTGEIDFAYNPMPLAGYTPVPLLDGRVLTLKELANEYEQGKENFVYSIQDNTNQVVPGKIVWAGKNYTANKLIRVWLDNNTYIDSAPEHPFITKYNEKIQAKDLVKDDILLTIGIDDVEQVPWVYEIENLENVNEDVYCLTIKGIDNENDRHNFSIYAFEDSTKDNNFYLVEEEQHYITKKIVVSNSIEENYYLPTFEGSTSDISMLEGASNLNDVEDYKIIKDDLFAGLKIPKSWLCLTGDTLVKSLDGKSYSMIELLQKYEKGEKVYVYSADKEGNVVPGEVSWVGATKKENKIYNIELDNGKIVRCSDNHPWMMKDGSYTRADELKEGDSLMPLYTRLTILKTKGGKFGYEEVWHNGLEKWQETHQLVGEWKYPGYLDRKNTVIHHSSFDKKNNHPDYLIEMDSVEHFKLHTELANNLKNPENRAKLKLIQQTDEFKNKCSQSRIKGYKENPWRKKSISDANKKYKKTNLMLESHAEKMKNKTISQFGDNNGNFKGLINKEQLLEILKEKKYYDFNSLKVSINQKFPEKKKHFHLYELITLLKINEEEFYKLYLTKEFKEKKVKVKQIDENKVKELIKEGKIAKRISEELNISNNSLNIYYLRKYKMSFFDYIVNYEKETYFNHKVKSVTITYLDKPEQLYDLTVNDYHNFALDSGTFVHNSFEEDLSNKAALCLVPQTFVILNDKRTLNLYQIEQEILNGKDIWVYCYDKIEDKVVETKVKWCKKTKKDANLLKVTLSNNNYIICTPEHKFIKKGGQEITAENLKLGTILQSNVTEDNIIIFVKKLEMLDYVHDTYDLEVENENHNFLTEAGVFVHNSEEDIRFAKTIQRVQRDFIEELLNLALVHLSYLGYTEEEMSSFKLEMNNPSTASEMKKNELLQKRFELAEKAYDSDKKGLNFMSLVDVCRTILKLNDEEIRQSIKNQFVEAQLTWRIEKIKEEGFYTVSENSKKEIQGLLKPKNNINNLKFENTKIQTAEQIDKGVDELLGDSKTLHELVKKKIDEEIDTLFPRVILEPSKNKISSINENMKKSKKKKTLLNSIQNLEKKL